MKKFAFFYLLISFLFVSCKKDYTCACTEVTAGITVVNSTTIHDTKNDAEDACNTSYSTVTASGITSNVNCSIQ